MLRIHAGQGWIVLVMSLLAGSWSLGQQPPPGVPTPEVEASDARTLETLVELELLGDPLTFASAVRPQATSQGLELCGYVPNQTVKSQALAIARRATRLQVIDRLTVQSNLAVALPASRAPSLSEDVRQRLQQVNPRGAQYITARVSPDGVIQLSGPAVSLDEKLQYSRRLRGVPGCTAVRNDLTVASLEMLRLPADARPIDTPAATQPSTVATASAASLESAPPRRIIARTGVPVVPPPRVSLPLAPVENDITQVAEEPARHEPRAAASQVPAPPPDEPRKLEPPALLPALPGSPPDLPLPTTPPTSVKQSEQETPTPPVPAPPATAVPEPPQGVPAPRPMEETVPARVPVEEPPLAQPTMIPNQPGPAAPPPLPLEVPREMPQLPPAPVIAPREVMRPTPPVLEETALPAAKIVPLEIMVPTPPEPEETPQPPMGPPREAAPQVPPASAIVPREVMIPTPPEPEETPRVESKGQTRLNVVHVPGDPLHGVAGPAGMDRGAAQTPPASSVISKARPAVARKSQYSTPPYPAPRVQSAIRFKVLAAAGEGVREADLAFDGYGGLVILLRLRPDANVQRLTNAILSIPEVAAYDVKIDYSHE